MNKTVYVIGGWHGHSAERAERIDGAQIGHRETPGPHTVIRAHRHRDVRMQPLRIDEQP